MTSQEQHDGNTSPSYAPTDEPRRMNDVDPAMDPDLTPPADTDADDDADDDADADDDDGTDPLDRGPVETDPLDDNRLGLTETLHHGSGPGDPGDGIAPGTDLGARP